MRKSILLALTAAATVCPVPAAAQNYYMRERLKAKIVSSGYSGSWTTGDWTTTAACTKGGQVMQTRSVSCSSGGSTVADSQCDPSTRPAAQGSLGTCRNSCTLASGRSGRSNSWRTIATYPAGSPQASRSMISLGQEVCGLSTFTGGICEAHKEASTGTVYVFLGAGGASPAFGGQAAFASEQAAGLCS